MNPELIVKYSPIQGTGVFAGRDFKEGEKVCFMRGMEVDFATIMGQRMQHDSCSAG